MMIPGATCATTTLELKRLTWPVGNSTTLREPSAMLPALFKAAQVHAHLIH